MASPNSGFSLDQWCTVLWTAKEPPHFKYVDSPEFGFHEVPRYHLKLWFQRYNNCDYNLYMVKKVYSGLKPFDVTVYLANGSDYVGFPTMTVTDLYKPIWECTRSEILKRVPTFNGKVLHLKVVLHSGGPSNGGKKTDDKSTQTSSDNHLDFESLSLDLGRLFVGDTNQDVTITCGNRSFKAHKNILSTRSEVFEAMFQSGMVEDKSGRVAIEDMEASTFQQFLEYLYTGKIPEITVGDAKRLYEASDRYAVDRLKKKCARVLAENLSRNTACEILILADQHSDSDLKENVIAYIVEERIPLDDDLWTDILGEQSSTAVEVLNPFCKLQTSNKPVES